MICSDFKRTGVFSVVCLLIALQFAVLAPIIAGVATNTAGDFHRFLEELTNTEASVRLEASSKLLQRASQQESVEKAAVPILAKALADPDDTVCVHVAGTLAIVGGLYLSRDPAILKPAEAALVQALDRKNEDVRESSVAALSMIYPLSKDTLAVLTKLTKDGNSRVAEIAFDGLAWGGRDSPETFRVLLGYLNDKDLEKRRSAVGSLGSLGRWQATPPELIPQLVRALDDADIRDEVVDAIDCHWQAAAESSNAVAKLLQISADPHEDIDVRVRTTSPLGKMLNQHPDLIDELTKLLNRESQPVQLRSAIAGALGNATRFRAKVVPILQKLLAEDTDVKVKQQAETALRRLSVGSEGQRHTTDPAKNPPGGS
jgi:HEAT repeat protein